MATFKTDDVYGITRDLPLNYVSRSKVDDLLIENLTREKHLVIYGSSKQGKTSLRKYCLTADDYIVVQCSSTWGLPQIHEAIVKRSGFRVTLSETRSLSGSWKINATAEIGGTISRTSTELELDLSDVNDVIRALDSISFSKYIVLEDFHYLSTDTQREFSVALKAYHESSKYCFIVVGVWLEKNRLTLYNGDLNGRIVDVDADDWPTPELKAVIDKGAQLLNIGFSDETKDQLIRAAFSSVYVVQEACRRLCRDEHVYESQPTFRVVGAQAKVAEVVTQIVAEQSGRYTAFIREFSDGFKASELQMYRWLLLPLLTANAKELERGLPQRDIRDILYDHHPVGRQLNTGNLTIALQSVANLQAKKNIKPIILDYDEASARLRVVDRGFFAWVAQQDIAELLAVAGFEPEFIKSLLTDAYSADHSR